MSRGGDAILITIPLSHYCEKARWALDHVGFPYVEQPHAPLMHRLATQRNAGGTVPVLVHGTTRLIDSTPIVVHADGACGGNVLYPRDAALRQEVEALEEQFDTDLGPHTRRWAYAQLLPDTRLLRSLWSRDVPTLEAALLTMIAPLVRRLVSAGYKITPESADRSLERVRSVFRQMNERLSDGRRFLSGDRFTAADLTFAALAAPMLLPDKCRATQPDLNEIPATMREEILRLRDSAAGQFAMRMFSDERHTITAT